MNGNCGSGNAVGLTTKYITKKADKPFKKKSAVKHFKKKQ